jgi:hypothetical protein
LHSVYTWRRIALSALILADKVFEDYAIWNADFLNLFPSSSINDLNALERDTLQFMDFMTTFKASDYARYYFALKELSDHKDVLPSHPLSQEQAEKLENKSKALGTSKKKSGGQSNPKLSPRTDVKSVQGMDISVVKK